MRFPARQGDDLKCRGNAAFVVASIGQAAPEVGKKSLGSFKNFLGRPSINGNGDVVFVATLTNSDVLPASIERDHGIPAGVFLYRRAAQPKERLQVVALTRDDHPDLGKLDLASPGNAATKADNIVDNVEQIDIDTAPIGLYRATVTHKGSLDPAGALAGAQRVRPFR